MRILCIYLHSKVKWAAIFCLQLKCFLRPFLNKCWMVKSNFLKWLMVAQFLTLIAGIWLLLSKRFLNCKQSALFTNARKIIQSKSGQYTWRWKDCCQSNNAQSIYCALKVFLKESSKNRRIFILKAKSKTRKPYTKRIVEKLSL